MKVEILLSENEERILKKVARLVGSNWNKDRITIDDLFNIIDELSSELDRREEEIL